MYLRFMGPFDQGGDWSDTGMKGMYRFVNKVWDIYQETLNKEDSTDKKDFDDSFFHITVDKIRKDLELLKFNTSIAEIMKFFNWFTQNKSNIGVKQQKKLLESFLLVLSVFMPHMSEELWHQFGHDDSVHNQKWPEVDLNKTKFKTSTLAIQVNGKTRCTIQLENDIEEKDIWENIKDNEIVKKYLDDRPRKIIYVKGRVINLVV